MDTAAEFTTWHIQCIYSPLETTKHISRYIQNVNTFLERVWEESEEAAPIPPQLEVDAVENSVVTHRGASIDAVRIRFKLPPEHRADNDTLHSAIRHFCERIFKLKAQGKIYSDIGLISSHYLIGIAPLSQWFKFYWTQGFLDTFVRRQVPLFNELADAELFWPWLGGAAFAVLASDQKSSDILRAIKISLSNNLRVFTLTLCEVDASTTAINEGAAQLRSDSEIELFNVVLEVFENGFEALTVNKEVFDEWQKIVSDAADRLRTAGAAAGAAAGTATGVLLRGLLVDFKAGGAGTSGVVRAARAVVDAIRLTASTPGAATAVAAPGAAGIAGGAALCSVAVISSLGLVVAASLIGFMHYRNFDKARGEKNKNQEVPSQTGEAHEIQDMKAGLNTRGMTPTLSLRDYKASLSSLVDVLRQVLQKMKEDPKGYFS
ncbi:hypothetical protein CEP52_003299 [Fusarium oligoseptatum]|uniref:Uncharacterized protein n=1 Tax=Fusarium oligoseptatum TaxID=2604345 RepID=A0A428U908_9HYPO|nr:hypothetical protein CEP52_003299 [Fusarium oligoseptatum]